MDSMQLPTAVINLCNQRSQSCLDLESVIQSEESQKEKNKYHMLTHMSGLYKNGTDELICKAEIETQM